MRKIRQKGGCLRWDQDSHFFSENFDFRDFSIMYPHFLVGQRESLGQKTPEINELGSPLSNAYLILKIGSVFVKLQSSEVGKKTPCPGFYRADLLVIKGNHRQNCPTTILE